jgi:carbonic anhydrase
MTESAKSTGMIKHLLSGHAHFRHEYFAGESAFLQHLASEGQRPSAMYVGCSDSRVIPELLTNSGPGQLFVVRNVGNLVPHAKTGLASVGAAVEFALDVLHVPHIIICGHDGCGGIRAALDGVDKLTEQPSLREWLELAKPAAAKAHAAGLEGEALVRQAVETNVLDQMDNLITYPSVMRGLANGKLQLHGWVYDMSEGSLRVYDVRREEFVLATDARSVPK